MSKIRQGTEHTFTGELLASAGDDGNVILWTPTDKKPANRAYGEDDGSEDKEWWNATRIFRSNTSNATNHEIYDLAWSPDGNFLVTGSMDNVTRIYDASTGEAMFPGMIKMKANTSRHLR
jgi:chromatin assembly factor 1 subunit B